MSRSRPPTKAPQRETRTAGQASMRPSRTCWEPSAKPRKRACAFDPRLRAPPPRPGIHARMGSLPRVPSPAHATSAMCAQPTPHRASNAATQLPKRLGARLDTLSMTGGQTLFLFPFRRAASSNQLSAPAHVPWACYEFEFVVTVQRSSGAGGWRREAGRGEDAVYYACRAG